MGPKSLGGAAVALAILLGAVTTGPSPAAERPGAASWRLTTYYTAVEQFHHGPPKVVHGCPVQDCQHGTDDLGRYPADFVAAVEDEGTGRITSGPNAGRYLNWSFDVGYWLDTVPADTDGHPLVPFETAAADPAAVAKGSHVVITGCGHQGGDPLDSTACDRFRAAEWVVRDAFTPGLGGPRHLDLYIGEEDQPGFTDTSPIYVDVTGARIAVTAAR